MEFAEPARINGAFIDSRILQTACSWEYSTQLASERRPTLRPISTTGPTRQGLPRKITAALQSGGRIVIKGRIWDADLT